MSRMAAACVGIVLASVGVFVWQIVAGTPNSPVVTYAELAGAVGIGFLSAEAHARRRR